MSCVLTKQVTRSVAVAGLLLAAATAGRAQARASESPYRRVDNWAQLPPGYSWGTMSAVAIDARGNVYGFQRDDPTSKVIQGEMLLRHRRPRTA